MFLFTSGHHNIATMQVTFIANPFDCFYIFTHLIGVVSTIIFLWFLMFYVLTIS